MESRALDGKRVLFICPKFFNYHKSIVQALRSMGAEVLFVPALEHTFSEKLSRRFSAGVHRRLIDSNYLKKIHTPKDCQYVFVVKGNGISDRVIEVIRQNNPIAEMILYQWDSLRNFDYLPLAKKFHRVLSFDRADCEEYGLEYLPLFYSDDYANIAPVEDSNCSIDILFVGSATDERIDFLRRMKDNTRDRPLRIVSRLYCSKAHYLFYWMRGKHNSSLTTRRLTTPQLIQLIRNSKAVLDVSNRYQTGLTMRTFEALGAGRMLLTTNVSIAREPFYDSDQIRIVSDIVSDIDVDALISAKPLSRLSAEYSLQNWLKRIFGLLQ